MHATAPEARGLAVDREAVAVLDLDLPESDVLLDRPRNAV